MSESLPPFADDGCCYIGNTGTACGARRRNNSSYCHHHHSICYLSPQASTEKLREFTALADAVRVGRVLGFGRPLLKRPAAARGGGP